MTHRQTKNDQTPLRGVKRVLRNRYFLIGGLLLAAYALTGFLLIPYLIRQTVPKIVEEQLDGRVARIGEVRTNPFLFTMEVNHFRLFEQDGTPIVRFDRLLVDFETSSLLRWAWTFKAISLERPRLNIRIDRDGVLNLVKMIPVKEPTEDTPQAEEGGPPPRMLFPKIKIANGEVDITDLRQSTPATVRILPLNVELEEISTLQDREGPYSLAATTAEGESFHWSGQITLHPFKSKGSLSFSNIKVDTLWEFFRDSVNLAQPAGRLHFETAYTLDLSRAKPLISLQGLKVRLEDLNLRLSGAGEPFCELQLAELSDAQLDLQTRRISVGGLQFKNGRVKVDVDADKRVNLSKIIRARDGDAAESQDHEFSPRAPVPTEPQAPFDVQVANVGLQDLSVIFKDSSRTPAVSAAVDGIDLGLALNAQVGGEDLQLAVQQLNIDLSGLRLGAADTDGPIIQVADVAASGGAFDLGQRNLTFARIELKDGNVDVVRDEEGRVNLVDLFTSPEAGTVRREIKKQIDAEKALNFNIDAIDLAGFHTNVSDYTVKKDGPVLNLDNLRVKLTHVDGKSPMDVDIDLDIRQGGHIRLNGRLQPKGPSLEARAAVEAIALKTLQPYVDPYLAIVLHSGAFSTQGQLRYGIADGSSQVAYQGGFDIGDLRITELQSDETLLGWRRLKTSQLNFRLQPGALEIGDMMLSGLVGKFIINEDGSVNVGRLVKTTGDTAQQPEPSSADQAAGTELPITIQQVRFEDGRVFFADLTLTPQFGTRIHDLDGFVSGVSSTPGQRAQVELEGQVADYGTTKIGGEIEIFNPKGFTDISVVFRNLEMADLTPYSGKFAGRRIDSGKLSLDLDYRIENSQLLGDNQIVVDQLTLGDTVDSPGALKLPLDLALAILEDANGVIDIGLPVKGSLDDPQFSIGRLVWKALTNLLKKIVTAPFRALGSLLGGGEENLEVVAFEPGQSEIPPPEVEKLHKLIKALEQRPQLQLVVQGRYNPQVDGYYFKDLAIRRQLATAMGIDLTPDEDPGPVAFGDPKTQKQLEKMFRERLGEPALTELMASLTPPPVSKADQKAKASAPIDPGRISKALFERLVKNAPLDDVVLQQLGEARGLSVSAVMTGDGGLPAARVATKASAALKTDEAPTAKLELDVMKPSP